MPLAPRRVPLLLAPLVASILSCVGVEAPATSASAIFGGVDDTTHTAVVGITIVGTGGLGTCTGSLIAPTLVLTARHCVSPVQGEGIVCSPTTIGGVTHPTTQTAATYPASSFYVTTDPVLGPGVRSVRAAEVITPADSLNVPFCGRDIALLRLVAPIAATPLMRPRLDLAPQAHDVFTASGYGSTSGAGTGSGTRRMRSGLSVEFVGRAVARGVTILEEKEWLANTGTCRGDSGGPALDEFGDVFGVLSRGAANSCDSPIYTRVDEYADWIRAQTARAATMGGYAPPAWVTPPPARPGEIGEACASDVQCNTEYVCRMTGAARECTTTDCAACPEGWVCAQDMSRCIHDPRLAPPPDAAAPPPDAAAPADAPAADAPAADAALRPPVVAQPSSGCNANAAAPSAHGAWALAAALAAVFGRRRRAKA
ncbi:MAG: trypsin-like serine protease [Polyangiales bacterium]